MKTFFKNLCILLSITIIVVFCSVGCENQTITAPEIDSVFDFVFWEKVDEANEYEIYGGSDLLLTVEDNFYQFNNLKYPLEISVVAKKGKLSSKKSNKVIVGKELDITDEQRMDIELSTLSKSISIPNTIRYLSLHGESTNGNILVLERTKDLVISLDNTTIFAPNGESVISTFDKKYDYETHRYSVLFIVEGENVFNGGTMYSQPGAPGVDSGAKGYKGYEGGSGIILPRMVISGSGSLTINGGQGGPGGQGADSSSWSFKVRGNGGDGGTGGSGIKCTDLYLNMSLLGTVTCLPAPGGNGGVPGSNGSIISAGAGLNATNGSKGESGSKLVGNLHLYSGSFN